MSYEREAGGLAVSAVIFILILVAGITAGGYYIYRWSSPKYEEVRRTTYEESQSYVRGKIQYLDQLKRDYEKSESENHKSSIQEIVLNETASFDVDKLPPHLKEWVNTLRNQ